MNAQCKAITGDYQIASASSSSSAVAAPNLLKRMLNGVVKRWHQRNDRLAFNNLLTLDDNMLQDIGVSRGDVQWASNLPLSADAAIELQIVSGRAKRQ